MAKEIVNRVERSGIITIDFEELLAAQTPLSFDIAPHLWQGLALKEKDFRDALANTDWTEYSNQHVTVFCSADAIVPTWAYMLVASYLQKVNATAFFGTEQETIEDRLLTLLDVFPVETLENKRVVIKGCGNLPLSPSGYVRATQRVQSVAKLLLFGEPCSTVPIYKKKLT
jgi:hypothetical protein